MCCVYHWLLVADPNGWHGESAKAWAYIKNAHWIGFGYGAHTSEERIHTRTQSQQRKARNEKKRFSLCCMRNNNKIRHKAKRLKRRRRTSERRNMNRTFHRKAHKQKTKANDVYCIVIDGWRNAHKNTLIQLREERRNNRKHEHQLDVCT